MIVRRFAALGCLSLVVAGSWALADEPAPPATVEVEKPAAAATTEEIAEWIKQLDHDGFNIRQAAQQKLAEAGPAAIDPLGEAALGESQEAATRAVEVLKQHCHEAEGALQQAAQAALKEIAASDNPIAVRRAEAALQSPAKPEATPADQIAPAIPAIPFGGGIIRRGAIRVEARTVIGGGKGKSISVKSVDGNKEINVEEDGRKVKIEESAEGKIKMSVTEKVDGKDETKSYEAESADALKKDHPEAHKIYDEYKQGGGIGRIEFHALPAEGGPLPIIPLEIPEEHRKRIEEAQKRLEETRKRLEAELPKFDPADEEKSSAAGQIDEALKQLENAAKQLGKANAEGDAEAKQHAIEALEAAKKQLEEAKAKLAK